VDPQMTTRLSAYAIIQMDESLRSMGVRDGNTGGGYRDHMMEKAKQKRNGDSTEPLWGKRKDQIS
jgi:hypothetical protein